MPGQQGANRGKFQKMEFGVEGLLAEKSLCSASKGINFLLSRVPARRVQLWCGEQITIVPIRPLSFYDSIRFSMDEGTFEDTLIAEICSQSAFRSLDSPVSP
jgi:hypothetical protein